ncbi:MAG: hypothetical protein ACXV39_10770 [Halobacteriota archaeon]
MSEEYTEKTEGGDAVIRKEGDKLVITIPNPNNKSIEDIVNIPGHDCSARCAGLVSNAAAFVF